MEWFSEFNHMQSLARLAELLEFESEPSKREALHDQLLAEEARLGQSKAQLERLEEFIRRGRERIRLQRAVVDGLEQDDSDHKPATSLLSELQRTQALFERHRIILSERLGRRR
jgi:hypothetical protein